MEGGVCASQFGKTWSKKCAFGFSVDFFLRNGYLSGLDIVSIFFKLKKDSFPIFKESSKRNLPN